MPLYNKSPKKGKQNQGAQWGDTGPAGVIHTVKTIVRRKGPISTKRGRNKSIGR